MRSHEKKKGRRFKVYVDEDLRFYLFIFGSLAGIFLFNLPFFIGVDKSMEPNGLLAQHHMLSQYLLIVWNWFLYEMMSKYGKKSPAKRNKAKQSRAKRNKAKQRKAK